MFDLLTKEGSTIESWDCDGKACRDSPGHERAPIFPIIPTEMVTQALASSLVQAVAVTD